MRRGIIATLVLATGFLASAGVTNITMTINGSGVANQLMFFYTYSGSGTAALAGLGPALFSASGAGNFINNVAGPTSGTFTFDFGGGNTMTGTFSTPSSFLVPGFQIGGFPQSGGYAYISGGTGIFAGASGTFPNVTGTGTVTGPNIATFTLAASGTVTLPGIPATPAPATFPLTVTGLGAAYLLCRTSAARSGRRSLWVVR